MQEALTNVVRHAEASQAWVELALENESITLTIQDNGKGFSSTGVKSHGIGIQGLRERLTMAGGSLTIRSTPGRGTILTASLPFTPTEASS